MPRLSQARRYEEQPGGQIGCSLVLLLGNAASIAGPLAFTKPSRTKDTVMAILNVLTAMLLLFGFGLAGQVEKPETASSLEKKLPGTWRGGCVSVT
jgi:hypothetical protein